MSTRTDAGQPPGEPGLDPPNPGSGAALGRSWSAEQGYLMLCLASLVVMFVTLVSRLGVWGLFPIVLGAVTVLLQWRPGFALTLLSIAVMMLAERIQARHGLLASWSPVDFGMCAAILALAVGHYRLQALRTSPFQPEHDRRQPPRPHGLAPKVVKPGSLADIATAVLTVLLCAGWGLTGGLWLLRTQPWLKMIVELRNQLEVQPRNEQVPSWNALEFIWLLGLALLFVRWLLNVLQIRHMTPEEGMLLLQDSLWQETRKEQRRINSWLAWSQSRRQKGDQ